MDTEGTRLLICDEPHALVTDARSAAIASFSNARKYALGATLTGRFDKKDRLLIGLFGPVLSSVSYEQAVRWKAISPLKVVMIDVPFSMDDVPGENPRRSTVIKMMLGQSMRMVKILRQMFERAIPPHWQTMVFIEDEKQADFLFDKVFEGEGVIAMAKKMKDKERKEKTAAIASGKFLRVLASKIYIQGLTFPGLKILINMVAAGAGTGSIQKPGRLLQILPGKHYGVLVDILFRCTDRYQDNREEPPYDQIVALCHSRMALYREIGYDIEVVNNVRRLREIIMDSHDEQQGEGGGDIP
jgi:superfamily II DNA or RNA helicase